MIFDMTKRISGGGGGGTPSVTTLLGSGSYTYSGSVANSISFPVSFSGTPRALFVLVDEELADLGQIVSAVHIYSGLFPAIDTEFPSGINHAHVRAANNSTQYYSLNVDYVKLNDAQTTMTLTKVSNNFRVQPNTYHWYIYGTPTT